MFLEQGLLLVWNSLVRVDWLASQPKWSFHLHSPKTGISSTRIMKQFSQDLKTLDRKSFKAQKVTKVGFLRFRKETTQKSQHVPENYKMHKVLPSPKIKQEVRSAKERNIPDLANCP